MQNNKNNKDITIDDIRDYKPDNKDKEEHISSSFNPDTRYKIIISKETHKIIIPRELEDTEQATIILEPIDGKKD